MKITIDDLKVLIKEEVKKSKYEPPSFSDYELKDLSTDEQMIVLLKDMLEQLKVLNYALTPAKTAGQTAREKNIASYTVAENNDNKRKKNENN